MATPPRHPSQQQQQQQAVAGRKIVFESRLTTPPRHPRTSPVRQQERRVSSSPTPAAEGGRRGRSWSPGQGGEGRRLQRDRTPSPVGGQEEEERRGSMGGNEVEEEWRDLIEDAREGYTGWVEEPSANPRDLEDMRIRVSVRKRPLSLKERSKGEVDVLQVAAGKGRVIVHHHKTRVDLEKVVESGVFKFDNGFGEDCGNRRVYKEALHH